MSGSQCCEDCLLEDDLVDEPDWSSGLTVERRFECDWPREQGRNYNKC